MRNFLPPGIFAITYHLSSQWWYRLLVIILTFPVVVVSIINDQIFDIPNVAMFVGLVLVKTALLICCAANIHRLLIDAVDAAHLAIFYRFFERYFTIEQLLTFPIEEVRAYALYLSEQKIRFNRPPPVSNSVKEQLFRIRYYYESMV